VPAKRAREIDRRCRWGVMDGVGVVTQASEWELEVRERQREI